MTITIGGRALAISRGGNFEARLIETTGCSVAEHAGMLASQSTAGQIARALAPMLVEPMPLGELASAIEASGVEQARQDVLALLTAAPDPAPVKSKAGDGAA